MSRVVVPHASRAAGTDRAAMARALAPGSVHAIGGDPDVRIEELDEAQPDRAHACRVVAAREVEVVVVLDLGARDDLVEPSVIARMLEVDGDHGAQRRRIGHLDEDSAGRDIARDRERIAVELAADHDQERLIEADMDALLDPTTGEDPRPFASLVDDRHRDAGEAAVLEDMGELQRFATLHNHMIEGLSHEVKELTLSYIVRANLRTGSAC